MPGLQVGPVRAKMKIAKLGIPTLDFSNLKTVKEYKDWFGYSKKLENAISLLREKIDGLENQLDLNALHKMKDDQTISRLTEQVNELKEQNKKINDRYKNLLETNYQT